MTMAATTSSTTSLTGTDPGSSMRLSMGMVFLIPYALILSFFVIYPVCYGFWMARNPQSYVDLYNDPIFFRALLNTFLFSMAVVNVKMILALLLSGFFIQQRTWIRWLSVLFILPWAIPSIPTIFSVRFMLNPEWGLINQLIFRWTFEDGPNWLNNPWLGLSAAAAVHIWKSLPFWTLMLMAGRLAIPRELYEAASVDGANALQKFRHITIPSIAGLYVTCMALAAIWSFGDFNSIYLLTGGGPADLTHVLATLGLRYLRLDRVDMAMAAIVCALPFILPIVLIMMKRLSR